MDKLGRLSLRRYESDNSHVCLEVKSMSPPYNILISINLRLTSLPLDGGLPPKLKKKGLTNFQLSILYWVHVSIRFVDKFCYFVFMIFS